MTEESTTIVADDSAQIEAAADDHLHPRDYEAEARKHGWRPKDEFKGDPSKWADAETFVRRADEVMPFLEKQNKALKREIDEMKRTMKQYSDFASKAEERAYKQALSDIEARHNDAIETGDAAAAKRAMADMRELDKEFKAEKPEEPVSQDDQAARKAELAEWVEKTGWYGTDEAKTKYADLQAELMGPAENWPGGQKAWLAELAAKTERKFADPKPNAANPGGTRPGPRGNAGRSYGDLPPEAKRQCDRFVKQIPGFTKEQYVKDYSWS